MLRLHAAGETAASVAARLTTAISEGRLQVRAHSSWCSPRTFHKLAMPRGQCPLAPTTSSQELTAYVLAPLVALWTLNPDVPAHLESTSPAS